MYSSCVELSANYNFLAKMRFTTDILELTFYFIYLFLFLFCVNKALTEWYYIFIETIDPDRKRKNKNDHSNIKSCSPESYVILLFLSF